MCPYGHGSHPNPSGVADASRFTDRVGVASTAPVNRAGGVPHDWRYEMTAATVDEPVSGYDSLKTKEVIASLSSRSQVELAEIEKYEHTHQNRVSVFDKLRWLRQDEPLPGYDALSSEEVLAALDKADVAAIKRVRGYERKFRARREILDEVDSLHRERRHPLVSRDTKR
jgi:Asp-tRNA(Asn)/Glu-tRNA(Gln) amidotransferase C subunit